MYHTTVVYNVLKSICIIHDVKQPKEYPLLLAWTHLQISLCSEGKSGIKEVHGDAYNHLFEKRLRKVNHCRNINF